MKTGTVLVAAVLAVAIGMPGSSAETLMPEPTTSTRREAAFTKVEVHRFRVDAKVEGLLEAAAN